MSLFGTQGLQAPGNKTQGWPLHKAVRANNVSEIERLLAVGVDPSCVDDRQKTALEYAIEYDYADAARVLLASGAPIERASASTSSHTFLADAVLFQSTAVAEVLLKAGASPNATLRYSTLCSDGYEEETLLHYAVCRGNVDIVQMLCNFGANSNLRNFSGQRPFSHEYCSEHWDLTWLWGLHREKIRDAIRLEIAKREKKRSFEIALGLAAMDLPVLLVTEMFSCLTEDESQVDCAKKHVLPLHMQWKICAAVKRKFLYVRSECQM